jgi:PilZ domain
MPAARLEFSIPVQVQLKDGARERIAARITRVSSGFLVLGSQEPVDASRKLEIFYLGRGIFSEAVYCHPEPDGSYRIGVRMLEGSDGVLRAERRIQLDALAELTTVTAQQPITVRVIDISSSGLGVKLDSALEAGQMAYVELEHGVAFGEIRYCRKIEGGYRAGLFVEEFIHRNIALAAPAASSARKAPSGVAQALRAALLPRKAS